MNEIIDRVIREMLQHANSNGGVLGEPAYAHTLRGWVERLTALTAKAGEATGFYIGDKKYVGRPDGTVVPAREQQAGYCVMVPREPTPEMIAAALAVKPIGQFYPGHTATESEYVNEKHYGGERRANIYRAMLEAAPQPQAARPSPEGGDGWKVRREADPPFDNDLMFVTAPTGDEACVVRGDDPLLWDFLATLAAKPSSEE